MGIEDSSSIHCHLTPDAGTASTPCFTSPTVNQTLLLLQSDDLDSRVQAAKEIRRLTKTSQRYRRHFSAAQWGPLWTCSEFCSQNCACVHNERNQPFSGIFLVKRIELGNKINIVDAGALKPIIGFLQSENLALQDYAAAALITLSASSINKPIITTSGAIPLLVQVLTHGSLQAKFDSIMALYNLSTHPDNLTEILKTKPIPPLVNLLKSCKKSSKATEKCTALIESLMGFEEGRTSLTTEEGGILAVVEVLEGGSLQSREHAVGALLTMCQSDRSKYREPILKEGVIPGLLELTVQGTPKSQAKAQMLLRLLRDTPYPRSELKPDTLENIVFNIISRIDGEDQTGKAKQMLAEMVQVSMEQSLRHLQQRAALVCAPADLAMNSCVSEVPSK
ncbi:hypothetical protein BUALT_Bualt04G0089200 [Buddleja alternifolia]|uniref:U-box domain-containing protein n=1 Tax=Buddleja alternifolia TaxID=168488 RepID=A0AAV6XNR6_9LAMI|nr:hypothetical protein BUALT_Bualt04G0089200 [Buddleja alternifolia]